MNMKPNDPIDRVLAEASSAWLEKLKRPSAADEAEFAAWLLESKRHVRHFLMMVALEEELRHFDKKRSLQPMRFGPGAATEIVPLTEGREMAVLVEASASLPNDMPAPSPPDSIFSRARVQRLAVGLALAAMLLIGVALWLVWSGFLSSTPEQHELVTAIGEQRALLLPEGSVVQLNTNSRIETRMSDKARKIRLVQGEALFKPRHDAKRPFIVYAGRGVIQSTGTQFNVKISKGKTRVAVLEGSVGIRSGSADSEWSGRGLELLTSLGGSKGVTAMVSAGHESTIDKNGKVRAPIQVADLEGVTAWTNRRLVFKQERLEDIVAAFNDYNRAPRFRIADSKVGDRRFSGVFNADAPESLRALLASEPGIMVQTIGNEILIRAGVPPETHKPVR